MINTVLYTHRNTFIKVNNILNFIVFFSLFLSKNYIRTRENVGTKRDSRIVDSCKCS